MTTERKVLSLRRKSDGEPLIQERLHKVLANAGLGSRRSLEERIAAGEVRVNGEIAQVGAQIENGDRVELDNRRFVATPCTPDETRVLMFNKPEGLVTSNDDPEGRPTVFEKLPRLKGARWVSVGRLDINTTGLLLLTTDGELANALMHPSREVEREYVCRIFGTLTDEHLRQMKAGVELEDGPAAFDEVVEIHRDEKHAWLRVSLREGRNREVRRLFEALGLTVSRLKRIRYGLVELPRELRRGHHRALDADQVQALRHSVGLGDAPQSLTLEPVVGQRRAPVRSNEFRPEPRQQRAWTGTSHEEARELRAFDRPLLDDTLGRRGRRGKPGAKAGPARKRAGGKPAGKGGPRPQRGPARGGGGAVSRAPPGRCPTPAPARAPAPASPRHPAPAVAASRAHSPDRWTATRCCSGPGIRARAPATRPVARRPTSTTTSATASTARRGDSAATGRRPAAMHRAPPGSGASRPAASAARAKAISRAARPARRRASPTTPAIARRAHRPARAPAASAAVRCAAAAASPAAVAAVARAAAAPPAACAWCRAGRRRCRRRCTDGSMAC